MAAIKTTFVLLLIAAAVLIVSAADFRVGPCDQVCPRIDGEKDECCLAHGYAGWSKCVNGQMYCRDQ